MELPEYLLEQEQKHDPSYQDLKEILLQRQSMKDSMDIFQKVMSNRQLLKESTDQEIQECLSRGCSYICGFSHLDFKDRSIDDREELLDSGSKLWRALSNQVFLNPE